MFDEIMPMMFDFDSAKPKVIPWRIQNTSAFISLLVDRYEAEGNDKYLKLASLYGDWLIKTQKADGGYYNQNTHYTCVIYPAKSLMELYHAELRHHDEYFREKGKDPRRVFVALLESFCFIHLGLSDRLYGRCLDSRRLYRR